jgi:branched-chain amino acid transport system substrate-binding protein
MAEQDGSRRKGWSAAAIAVGLGALSLTSGGAFAKDPIEIGMAVALTGYLASYDGQFIDGVKLRTEQANASGGIDGHKINRHVLDNASNATMGVTVTNQLLNQFNVSVMLNGLSSAQNQAIEPILERAEVPQLVFSVLPQNPKWAFLVNLLNERIDALQIDFADQKLHAKKIALVYSQTPYGQNAAKFMSERAKRLGFEIVYSQAVEPSATDMTPQLAALKAAGADAVIDVLTGSTHIVEAKAAATVGLSIPIVMATDDIPTHQKVAVAYPQSYFAATAVQVFDDIENPGTKAACAGFIKQYQSAGRDIAMISGASFGWDAMGILEKAVIGGPTGGSALHEALEKTEFQGCNTLYKYSASDHSGQMDVPMETRIAKVNPDGKITAVFFEPRLQLNAP